MKLTLTVFLILSVLLTACNSETVQSLFQPNHPTVSTEAIVSSPDPTIEPQGNSFTPTPEVFNPLDPSPTTPVDGLPLTCQVTDLNVQIDRPSGYCYAYPKQFRFDTQPFFNVQAVQGPEVGSSTEPVFATFYVETNSTTPDQTLEKQADAFLKDFTTVDPASLIRVKITLGGEQAIMVDQVPGYLSWRIVFAVHDGKLYRLMYWPVDVPEAQADVEELYQTTVNSFAFFSATEAEDTQDQ